MHDSSAHDPSTHGPSPFRYAGGSDDGFPDFSNFPTPAQQAAMTTALRNAALAQAAQGNGVGHGRPVGANDAHAVKCDLFRSARHVRAVLLLMVTLILGIAAVATPQ